MARLNFIKQHKKMFVLFLIGFGCIISTNPFVTSAPQQEKVEPATDVIKLYQKGWIGSIRKGETKNFSINLVFPHEGTFYISTRTASFDKTKWGWTNITMSGVSVTTSIDKEAVITEGVFPKRSKSVPVKGVRMRGEPGASGPAIDTSIPDTFKKTQDQPYVHIHPWVDKPLSPGEGPFIIKMKFISGPKIGEPATLLLSATSTSDFDSLSITFSTTPDSVQLIK